MLWSNRALKTGSGVAVSPVLCVCVCVFFPIYSVFWWQSHGSRRDVYFTLQRIFLSF